MGSEGSLWVVRHPESTVELAGVRLSHLPSAQWRQFRARGRILEGRGSAFPKVVLGASVTTQ